jgi:hypothetical protein
VIIDDEKEISNNNSNNNRVNITRYLIMKNIRIERGLCLYRNITRYFFFLFPSFVPSFFFFIFFYLYILNLKKKEGKKGEKEREEDGILNVKCIVWNFDFENKQINYIKKTIFPFFLIYEKNNKIKMLIIMKDIG